MNRDLIVLTFVQTDSEKKTLTLPVIVYLECIWLKGVHFYKSESLSNWAEKRFRIEIRAKSEAGGTYKGGACIKKRVHSKWGLSIFIEFSAG